jgi:hypothetical protein
MDNPNHGRPRWGWLISASQIVLVVPPYVHSAGLMMKGSYRAGLFEIVLWTCMVVAVAIYTRRQSRRAQTRADNSKNPCGGDNPVSSGPKPDGKPTILNDVKDEPILREYYRTCILAVLMAPAAAGILYKFGNLSVIAVETVLIIIHITFLLRLRRSISLLSWPMWKGAGSIIVFGPFAVILAWLSVCCFDIGGGSMWSAALSSTPYLAPQGFLGMFAIIGLARLTNRRSG